MFFKLFHCPAILVIFRPIDRHITLDMSTKGITVTFITSNNNSFPLNDSICVHNKMSTKKIIKSVVVHFLQIKLIFSGRRNYPSSFFRFSYYKSITILLGSFFFFLLLFTICLATYLKFDNIFCHYQFFLLFFFCFFFLFVIKNGFRHSIFLYKELSNIIDIKFNV